MSRAKATVSLKEPFRRQTSVGRFAFVVPLSVGQLHVIFRMSGALIRMLGQISLPVMQDAVLIVRTDAQIPQSVFQIGRAEHGAAHRPNLERRPHGAIDFRQSEVAHFRHDLPQLARHVPAHAQLAEKGVNRIERTAMVVAPDVQVLVVVLVDPGSDRVAPRMAGEFFPRLLRFSKPLPMVTCPGLARDKLHVVAHQRQPVRPGDHAKSIAPQPLRGHPRLTSRLALADENLDRHRVRRRREDIEPAAGDLFDVGLQLARPKLSGAGGLVGDDNLRPRLSVLDDPGSGVYTGTEERTIAARIGRLIAAGFIGDQSIGVILVS